METYTIYKLFKEPADLWPGLFLESGKLSWETLKKLVDNHIPSFLNKKRDRINIWLPAIICYCRCNKFYKIQCNKKEFQEERNFQVTIFTNNKICCKCSNEQIPQLRGTNRDNMKELLKYKSASQISDNFFNEPVDKSKNKALKGYFPKATLNVVAKEMRDEDVKDRNHIIDVIKRFQDQSLPNVAEVSVYKNKEDRNKFRMILVVKNQLEILANWLKQRKQNNFKRIHLDATGKITMKIFESELLHHVLVIGIPKADDQSVCNLVRPSMCAVLAGTVPVFDALSRVPDIDHLSRFFKNFKICMQDCNFSL